MKSGFLARTTSGTLLFLGLLSCTGCRAPQHDLEYQVTARLSKSIELPCILRDGLAFVQARVGNRFVWCLLDTGASADALNQRLVNHLNLRTLREEKINGTLTANWCTGVSL